MAEDNSNRHVFPNLEIREKLEKMLNNEKFSDTVFHVNNSQFHASSHLVSVSSNVLESMLDDHYNNCGDRDIKIGNVKQGASFSIILRYLYGLEIDFEDMTRDVLCEVLGLAERFDLNNFYKELKTYISNLDCFQIESTVVLLNTAKKYDIEELYEKVKIFAFDNTDALVKDSSFAELQYDVLRDLVKSDWFCTSEIDILRGVLMWHSENLKKETNNEGELFVNEKEEDESKTGEDEDHCDAEDIIEDPDITANENCTQLVKTFSENVLKTLLSHIRIKQISLDDYITSFKTELFMSYDLLDSKQFCQVDEPRKKGVVNNKLCKPLSETISYMDLNDKHIFTMVCHKSFSFSKEICLCDIKFRVLLKDNLCSNKNLPFNSVDDVKKVVIYLECRSDILVKWECIVECKLKILKPDLCFYGILIPEHTPLIPVKFTPDNNARIGEFYYPTSYHDYDKHGSQEFKFEIFFESIKLNERAK